MVIVCDADTGFAITKKGRKDIFDLGVSGLRVWREEMPSAMKKAATIEHGSKIVE